MDDFFIADEERIIAPEYISDDNDISDGHIRCIFCNMFSWLIQNLYRWTRQHCKDEPLSIYRGGNYIINCCTGKQDG